jgi:hypothetical protein
MEREQRIDRVAHVERKISEIHARERSRAT